MREQLWVCECMRVPCVCACVQVATYRDGKPAPQLNGGLDSQRVQFYFDEDDVSFERVGERTVWAWPFPEVGTVAEHLRLEGNSDVRMGTAPEAWNVIMGAFAKVCALWYPGVLPFCKRDFLFFFLFFFLFVDML